MNPPPARLRVDMHTHCEHSFDSRTTVAAQAVAIRAAGLQAVCATDHDTIEGALQLSEIADEFQVIVGQEVDTSEGQLIGLFLASAIEPGLTAQETIALVKAQGGLVIVPHPFSRNRPGHLRREALDRLWPMVDAIEVFNSRESSSGANRMAAAYARERHIAEAAGSDAHRAEDLGLAYVEMDAFDGAGGFLHSLRTGTVHGRLAGRDRLGAMRRFVTG